MARLIEIDGPFSTQINLQTGDLLQFAATGGTVISGMNVVELLGPFYPGIVTSTGDVIEPAGSPNKVLFLARNPGLAKVQTFWGDSWSSPTVTETMINVVG